MKIVMSALYQSGVWFRVWRLKVEWNAVEQVDNELSFSAGEAYYIDRVHSASEH